ncbi:PREDICTED: trypsin epsilon-like [Ceratosolen solmsi marchali]|uniref:Trypsin epsilon-like n=1 Tax=Ceratosolen solmsi marchali TaxID=326594 RepID=A0AAJ6VNI5_9HYME|nr:PREDICTED: trypsin epsilon-like [Ceratosolen solmsi marchali]
MVGSNVRPATFGQFPYIVSLMNLKTFGSVPLYMHFCTAALISKCHVISSAQCTEKIIKNETKIHAGSLTLTNGRKYDIAWWINYNDWCQYKSRSPQFEINDIGIIKIDSMINDIRPGIFLLSNNRDLYGKNAVIAGWGKNSNGNISNSMMSAILEFISNETCELKIKYDIGKVIHIHERYLCTSAYYYILIQEGDYGGPVLSDDMIIGINKETNSLSDIPIQRRQINIHTGITYYLDFITETTRYNFQWQ